MPSFRLLRAWASAISIALFPKSTARIIQARMDRGESEDPISDASLLLELYQRIGDKTKAREQYELITAMMRAMRAIAGPQFTVTHCMVLVTLATFERDELKDHELAYATARRAIALARLHGLTAVIDLAQYRFQEIAGDNAVPTPVAQRSGADQ